MASGQQQQRTRTEQLLQAATAYAERGWRVFPLHNLVKGGRCSCGKTSCGASAAKHPRTRSGLKDASNRIPVLRAWWDQWPQANIGVATGARSGFLVLDVDPRDHGDESFLELEKTYGKLPGTFSASTGGGGKHYLFQHPGGDVVLRNVTALLPGIDIKADGGYIVAAPSLHASGAYYQWDVSDDTAGPDEDAESELPIAPCPDWLLALLSRPQGGEGTPALQRTHDPRPNDGAASSAVTRGQYWLDYYLQRTGEGRRNDHGFKLALQLRNSGLSYDEAEGFMCDYAASVPGSDYTAREALASLRQAYQRAPREDNYHTPRAPDALETAYQYTAGVASAATFEKRDGDSRYERREDSQSDTGEPKARVSRFRLMTDTEVETMAPPEWLINGFLPANRLSVAYGEFGSCKSFLLQDWALCVTTGQSWLGKHPVKQGIVVYIAGEGIGGMGRRIRAWKAYHGYQGSTGLYVLGHAPQFLQAGDVSDLIDAIHMLPEAPALIIDDTLARSMVGGDENSAKDMGLAVAGADRLREEFGSAVCLVHHKPSGASKTRGSTALPGAVDTLIEVVKDGENVTVLCGKQKEAAPFNPLYLRAIVQPLSENDPDDSSLVLDVRQGNQRNMRPTLPRSADKLLGILRNSTEAGLRYTDLKAQFQAESGMAESSFNNALDILQDARLIKNMGGFWMTIEGTPN